MRIYALPIAAILMSAIPAPTIAQIPSGKFFDAAARQNIENGYQTAQQRRYIRGPKGGCNYIKLYGNKQYVPRELCY